MLDDLAGCIPLFVGTAGVVAAELDPDDAVGVLLDEDVVHFAVAGANGGDLVLDVHEEGGVAPQVHLGRVEHPNERHAVRGSHHASLVLGSHLLLRGTCWIGGGATWEHHRVLVATQLLHQGGSILCRMNVRVCRVLAKVLLCILVVIASLGLWAAVCSFLPRAIGQNVHLELGPRHQLEAIHGLCGRPSLLMTRELDDRVAPILARVGVFRQLNGIYLAERGEELSNVLLCQSGQGTHKTPNVDPIVLFALGVLIPRCQGVAKRRDVVFVRLLVLVCSSSPVFFSLRCVDHNCLSAYLLVAHGEGHKDGLRSVKLHVGDPVVTQKKGVKHQLLHFHSGKQAYRQSRV